VPCFFKHVLTHFKVIAGKPSVGRWIHGVGRHIQEKLAVSSDT